MPDITKEESDELNEFLKNAQGYVFRTLAGDCEPFVVSTCQDMKLLQRALDLLLLGEERGKHKDIQTLLQDVSAHRARCESTKLNKEICARCRMRDISIRKQVPPSTFEEDWERGCVACPILGDQIGGWKERADIYDEPPKGCKFYTEHVITREIKGED